MKAWFLKWRISSALDARKPMPPSLETAKRQSDEACRFASDSEALARALKDQAIRPEVPPSLHTSIMRAVRITDAAGMKAQFSWPRWAPIAGFAVLILLGALLAGRISSHSSAKVQPTDTPSLAAAGSVLEMGDSIVREAPAAAMSPMYDEMNYLNRDLDSTKEFLLASLP